jgi:iron complex outermembrane receptor protein
MNKALFKTMLYTMSALGLIKAAPVLAQAAPTAAAGGVEQLTEIVVTARRVEERAQDVPISMTVFNQQELSNANIVEAQDLVAITPSLSVNNDFGGGNTTFSLRGFSQDIGTQPTVGVYFADVVAPRGAAVQTPVGDGAGPGSFFDLQSVEVLKGPQGTLFGRNTTGGAVLLVPQKPTGTQEGYAEVSYGNFDMRRVQAVENLPLSDTARFRIGVDRLDRVGYTNNDTGIGPQHFENVNYLAIRASLVVDLSPNLENYTIFSYTHSNTDGTDQKLVACDPTSFLGAALACPALARQGTGFYTVQNIIPDPFNRTTQFQLINTTTWHANDLLTVKNIASYAELTQTQDVMLFGTDFNTADLGAALHLPVPASTIPFAESVSLPGGYLAAESTSVDELQVQARSSDDRLNGQGGVYVEESNPLATAGAQSPVFLNCSNVSNFQCADATSFLGPAALGSVTYNSGRNYFHDLGVYGQGTYSVTDQLSLTGGLRYTRDSTDDYGQLASYAFPAPNTPVRTCNIPGSESSNCNVIYHQNGSAPTWLIDLDYKPVQDVLTYLKYTRGYREGGISLLAPTGFNTFKPEKLDSYEAGFKTSFHGAVSGTFDAAAFYNNLTNQQLQLNLTATEPGIAPAEATFNAGKSRIYGLEVNGSIILFTGFSLNAGYTYLDTRLQSIAPITPPAGTPYIVQAPIQPGDQLELSPKNKYSVTGSYALPFGDDIGHVSASVNFTHTDKQISNYSDVLFPNNPSIYDLRYLQARNLVNANLNWNKIAGTGFDLGIFGTNLTNQQYYTFVGGLIQSVGFETAQLGQPRMYGARLRYSW